MDDLKKFKQKILNDKERIKKEKNFEVIYMESRLQRYFRILKDKFLFFLYKHNLYK
jgi:hypothetical protein